MREEELELREAALRALEANEAVASAERNLEEATVQRAPLCRSDRLRGLTAGAVLACRWY